MSTTPHDEEEEKSSVALGDEEAIGAGATSVKVNLKAHVAAEALVLRDWWSLRRQKGVSWYRKVLAAYPHLRLRRDERGDMLVHHLCKSEHLTLPLLRLLLTKSAREQLLARDSSSEQVIRVLARCSRVPGAIELVLRLCPEVACFDLGAPGHPTALHILCDNHTRPSLAELRAFQRFAPDAFTRHDALTGSTALHLWCHQRGMLLHQREKDNRYRPDAEREAAQEAVDREDLECARLFVSANPIALVAVKQRPWADLPVDDSCRRLLVEVAMRHFPEHTEHGTFLHDLCQISSQHESILPLLRLAMQHYSQLTRVAHFGHLPLRVLADNPIATVEQLALLLRHTPHELVTDDLAKQLLEVIVAAPTEADMQRTPPPPSTSLTLLDAANDLLELSHSFSTLSASDHDAGVDVETVRSGMLVDLLARSPSAINERVLAHLCRRDTCSPDQLRVVWSAVAIDRSKLDADDRSIFRPLLTHAEVSPALKSEARLLFRDACEHALARPHDQSDKGTLSHGLLVDFALLFAPEETRAQVFDALDRMFCEASQEAGADAPASLHPSGHRAFACVDSQGETLILRRLAHEDVPLSEHELAWVASRAPFALQATQAKGDECTVWHLLAKRADITPQLLRIAMAPVALAKEKALTTHTYGTKLLLPLDFFLEAAVSREEAAWDDARLEAIVRWFMAPPEVGEGAEWSPMATARLVRSQLAGDPASAAGTPCDRPIHTYLRASMRSKRPRTLRMMELLTAVALEDEPTPAALSPTSSSSSLPSGTSVASAARISFDMRGEGDQTPLHRLCAGEVLLFMEELDWLGVVCGPAGVARLLAQTDAYGRNCLHRLCEKGNRLPLDLWRRVLEVASDEALAHQASGGRAVTCAHDLCAQATPDEAWFGLIDALFQRAPWLATKTAAQQEPLCTLPWVGLRHFERLALHPLVACEARLNMLASYVGHLSPSYISESSLVGEDQLFLLRMLRRMPGVPTARLFAQWADFLSSVLLHARHSTDGRDRLLNELMAPLPDGAGMPASHSRVLEIVYRAALLTATSAEPFLALGLRSDDRCWFSHFEDAQRRFGPRTRTEWRAEERKNALFDFEQTIIGMLRSEATRADLWKHIESGAILRAAVTPESSWKLAEAIRLRAVVAGCPLSDEVTMHVQAEEDKRAVAALARMMLPTWPVVLRSVRGRIVLDILFFTLLRHKERRLLERLLALVRPFNPLTLPCYRTGASALHVLCNETRGCRERIFDLFLAGTVAASRGSCDVILQSRNEKGVTLREVLDQRHNSGLREALRYEMEKAKAAAPQPTSMKEATSSPPFAATAAAPAAASTERLPSRLNFITYDHIVALPLETCLDAAAPNGGQKATPLEARREELSPLPSPSSADEQDATRSMSIYSIKQLLSPAECARLVAATSHQDSLNGEYTPAERDSTRLLCRSPGLARALWSRLSPMFAHRREFHRRPMGFGTFGRWEPARVNECFRFSTYQPGSRGFQPHRDAPFVESTAERSVFTLLIYLTDGATGETDADGGAAGSTVEDGASSSGSTTFYVPTKFTPGGLIRDELPRRVHSVTPARGHALLFPHELLHSGDAVSRAARSAKCILRTDIVFRRFTPLPLLSLDRHWRNDPTFLAALELFQAAFKHELAGRGQEAADAYERSLSLRAAPVLTTRPAAEAAAAVAAASPALGMAAHCLQLVHAFLDAESKQAAAATCFQWWLDVSSARDRRQAQPQPQPQSQPPHQRGESRLERIFPFIMTSTEQQQQESATIDGLFACNDESASIERRLAILPRVTRVGGIACLMSYQASFYRSHPVGCRRVMAVLAALTLSHHLPLVTHEPLDLWGRGKKAAWPPLSEEAARRSRELLATRCALSYHRANDAHASRVEWCRFDALVSAAFHGTHLETRVTSLEEFNATAATAAVGRTASSSSSPPPPPPQCVKQRLRPFTFGDRRVPSAGVRGRHMVALGGILPSFYHAAMCCSKQFVGGRHELTCSERGETMLPEKRTRQQQTRRKARLNDAEELLALDSARNQDIQPLTRPRLLGHAPPPPPPPL